MRGSAVLLSASLSFASAFSMAMTSGCGPAAGEPMQPSSNQTVAAQQLDGSTGQNALEQAKHFTAATDVSALTITKLDGTAKGGVVLAIASQFRIPVKFIGVGEKAEDLLVFDKEAFVDGLFTLGSE